MKRKIVTTREYVHTFSYANFFIALTYRKNNISKEIFMDEYVEFKGNGLSRRYFEATDKEREELGINDAITEESLKVEKTLKRQGW